jgi:A1 cistron-splicing factor AAR2
MRWRANLGGIWERPGAMMPYRQSVPRSSNEGMNAKAVRWEILTSHITPSLLNRVLGENAWTITTASSARRDADDLGIPGITKGGVTEALFAGEEGEKELTFLPVDLKKTWREGAIGRERTDAAKDRSWALGDLLERFCHGEEGEVLGELQLTFWMVVTVGCWSCLEQWKRLLNLLFTCEQAVGERDELFKGIIGVLKCQLRVAKESVDDGGLFWEDMGFLQGLLRVFWRKLEESEVAAVEGVRKELEALNEEVKEIYGWELKGDILKRGMLELEDGEMVEMEMNGAEEEDETGEYAPVVVDLDGLGHSEGVNGEERSIPMR